MEKKEKSTVKKIIQRMLIAFLILTSLIVAILLYSRYFATHGLVVKEYRIVDSSLPSSFHGYKIAHVSDLHYGRTTDHKDLEQLVKKINLTKPDLLLFTGDFIDEETELTEALQDQIQNILASLDSSILKYAISGEEDVSFGSWSLILENSDFRILDDDYDTIYRNATDYLLLSGMGTTSSELENFDQKMSKTVNYLKNAEANKKPAFSVFMVHNPNVLDSINVDDFNLVLAGHTHAGQIRLPGIGGLLYPDKTNYKSEYQQLDHGELFISSGIGTSQISFRFFNRPSFNLYRLVQY